MDLELRIYKLETEQRWRWLGPEKPEGVVAEFISFRDDNTFVSLTTPGAPARAEAWKTVRLSPVAGSTNDITRIAHSPVLEIRLYRIAPGKRESFTKFFAERCLEPLTRCGMAIDGQYESLDDETTSVWFRGFPDLLERDRRKAAFYESALWLDELEDVAFSMIEDYSNVLLVTPVQ
jgi:hypothetical protein